MAAQFEVGLSHIPAVSAAVAAVSGCSPDRGLGRRGLAALGLK